MQLEGCPLMARLPSSRVVQGKRLDVLPPISCVPSVKGELESSQFGLYRALC